MRVLCESPIDREPSRWQGFRAAALWFPYGAGEAFRRELRPLVGQGCVEL